MSDVKYLIFDIETVGDGDLIRKVRYPAEDLTPREAVDRYRRQLREETGKDVLPLTFVLPVSVAIAKVAADFRLLELIVLDSPEFRPQEIVRRFWQGWQHYQRPTLVTFNGRGYDVPVLEMAAFRFGISIPAWFNVDSRAFEQSRNRYNHNSHLDLQEQLTNFGSFRMSGGLNLLATLIDKPGKSGIDGSQVQDLYYEGHVDQINDYCRCDVLDTYFVFLRSRVLLGKLTLQEEQTLTEIARDFLSEQAENHPAYEHYLRTWDIRLQQKMDVMQAIGVPPEQAVAESDSAVVHAEEC
ncbi:MAG TPA: 3'-5' exonuclease [Planctomycetaceae bacterium]|nr:3'-5' exonuclease [Planctomycetaceae bacterium]HRA89558.1 3'-5' exonuclease [Planctomycetaceae bacterium]